MSKDHEQQLSRRERQIMDALHARGKATAAQVMAALPDPPSYSAVRALLRILEDKGHIKRWRDGARYVYKPRRSRQTARRSAMKRLVSTFFDGSVASAVAALIETADAGVSDAELDRLQKIIHRAKTGGS